MKYVYIDGDDIGLQIEKALLTGDEAGLQAVNQAVSHAIGEITDYLTAHGCHIIFSGADGVIFKASKVDIPDLRCYLAGVGMPLRFSVGIGNSLRESFMALRYAKARGKNGIAVLDSEFAWFGNGCVNDSPARGAEGDAVRANSQSCGDKVAGR